MTKFNLKDRKVEIEKGFKVEVEAIQKIDSTITELQTEKENRLVKVQNLRGAYSLIEEIEGTQKEEKQKPK